MLNFSAKPDYKEAFSILTDEYASEKRLNRAKKALRCKTNTPREYMALVFLCALRGVWGKGDRYKTSFDMLLSFLGDHSFFPELKDCVSSPAVKKEYERGAVRHNYYALSYLAFAYHYGWGADINEQKAKELVLRAKKIGGDMPQGDCVEAVFSAISKA